MSDLDPQERSVGERLAQLEDVEQLRSLKASYFQWVDDREWTRLRGLFADECEFSSSVRLPVFAGPDDFLVFVRDTVEPGTSMHLGFMPRIEVDGDHGRSVWSMYDRVQLDDGRVGWQGFGRYRERYRRGADGRWRIVAWHLERGLLERLEPINAGVER